MAAGDALDHAGLAAGIARQAGVMLRVHHDGADSVADGEAGGGLRLALIGEAAAQDGRNLLALQDALGLAARAAGYP